MKKSLLSLMICFMSFAFMHAQSIQVSGKVTDGSNGDALPGVSVAVVGTTTGTITDIDGNFSLSVPSDASLAVSFIGYAMQQVAVAGQSTVNIVLQPDLISLDEVVAVGYGVVKKRDITGSVGSVSADKLNAAPITSLDAGLQGKIAGVTIKNTSGAPGQKMKIRIRGGSSINYSNEPLYVIDGFIGADITTVNPNDIATIDILKDASATAVYGSRGANGVVLITTSAPKEGKLRVSLDATYGVSNMVNEYSILRPEETAELYNEQYIANGKDAPFSAADITDMKSRGGTDWQDLVTQTGVKQNYTLNLTGGNEQLKYFFSANHVDDKGVMKNTYYKRSSIRSNIAGKIGKRIDFKFNTYGTHTSNQGNQTGTGGKGNTIASAVLFPSMWPARDAEGEIMDPNDYNDYNGVFLTGRNVHPEQKVKQNQESYRESVVSNLDLTIDLGHNLELFMSNSGSFYTFYNGNRKLMNDIDVFRGDVTATQKYGRGSKWIHTDILSYENDFGRHHLKASAVYEYSKNASRSLDANVGSLSTLGNEWHIMSNGQPTTTSSSWVEGSMRSYMGRVNYSFADKYLLTASLRGDGTSVFQEDYRWGYFPSAALAWRASEESFIKNIEWIHNFKVRAGFGSTGNTAVGTYATLPRFDTSAGNAKFRYYIFDGTPVEGVIPADPTDFKLKWETTTQYNFGVDFAILGGKVSTTLDVYSKKSEDVIIAKSIGRYTGYPAFTDNYADIDNNGFELGIDWQIMNRNDFNWSANFNLSRNKNVVQDLDGLDEVFLSTEQPIGIWSLVGGNNKFVVQKGESMGSLYGLKAIGLWQADQADLAAKYGSKPGEVRYEDIDRPIDPETGEEVLGYSASDRQIIGQTAPDFSYGLSTDLSYKNWDMSIQCVGTIGNEIYNWTDNMLNQQSSLLSTDYRNRWSATNTNATQQIAPYGTDYSMTYVVSQYVEKGSFFKVNNITLGYTFPKLLTDKLHLGSVRVFASANNVLTITDYSGLDPEASSTPLNSDSQAGVDAFSYPLTRTITGGVKINF